MDSSERKIMKIDRDGYPLKVGLNKIQHWTSEEGFHNLMDYIEDGFRVYGSFERNDNIYMMSTGGWSGCEDIIYALEINTMFWLTCWQESKRGGHYEFKIGENHD